MPFVFNARPRYRYVSLPNVSSIGVASDYYRDLKLVNPRSEVNPIQELLDLFKGLAPVVVKTPNVRVVPGGSVREDDRRSMSHLNGPALYPYVLEADRAYLGIGQWLAALIDAPYLDGIFSEWLVPTQTNDEYLKQVVPLVGVRTAASGKKEPSYLVAVSTFYDKFTLLSKWSNVAQIMRAESIVQTLYNKTEAVKEFIDAVEEARNSDEYKALAGDRSLPSILWRTVIENVHYLSIVYVAAESSKSETEILFNSNKTYDLLQCLHDDESLQALFQDFFKYTQVADSVVRSKLYLKKGKSADQVERIQSFAELVIIGYQSALTADLSETIIQQFLEFRRELRPTYLVPRDILPDYESKSLPECPIKGLYLGAKIRDANGYPVPPVTSPKIQLDLIKDIQNIKNTLAKKKMAKLVDSWNDFVDEFFSFDASEFQPAYYPVKALLNRREVYYHFIFDNPYAKNAAFVTCNYAIDPTDRSKIVITSFGEKGNYPKADDSETDPDKTYQGLYSKVTPRSPYSQDTGVPITALQYPATRTRKDGVITELSFWGDNHLDDSFIELWQDSFYRCSVARSGVDDHLFVAKAEARAFKMYAPSQKVTKFDLMLKGSVYENGGLEYTAVDDKEVSTSRSKGAFGIYDPMILLLSLNIDEKKGAGLNIGSIFERRVATPTSGSSVFELENYCYKPAYFTTTYVARHGRYNLSNNAANRLVASVKKNLIAPAFVYSKEDLSIDKRLKTAFVMDRFITVRVPYPIIQLGSNRRRVHIEGRPYFPLNSLNASDSSTYEASSAYLVSGMSLPRFRVRDDRYFGSMSEDYLTAQITTDMLDVPVDTNMVSISKLDDLHVYVSFDQMFGVLSKAYGEKAFTIFCAPKGVTLADFFSYISPRGNIVADTLAVLNAFYYSFYTYSVPSVRSAYAEQYNSLLEKLKMFASAVIDKFGNTILQDKAKSMPLSTLLILSSETDPGILAAASNSTINSFSQNLQGVAQVAVDTIDEKSIFDVLNVIAKVLHKVEISSFVEVPRAILNFEPSLLFVDWRRYVDGETRFPERKNLNLFPASGGLLVKGAPLPREVATLATEVGAQHDSNIDLQRYLDEALSGYLGWLLAENIGQL